MRHSFLSIVVVVASIAISAAAPPFETPLLNQLCSLVDLFLREVWALAPPPGVTSVSETVSYRFESAGSPLCLDKCNVRWLWSILLILSSTHWSPGRLEVCHQPLGRQNGRWVLLFAQQEVVL